MASIIDLYNSDQNLQKCNPKDLVNESLKAAILKLPINKTLGFAYLVPYNNSVKVGNNWEKKMIPTFTIGYKGLIQLAMRTGQYRIINADSVFEGEAKVISKLSGELAFDGAKKSDTIVGYFAHFELSNGFQKTFYMTTEQIKAHAKRFSKSYGNDKSPWTTDFESMALKTCLRLLLSKYGYLSIEMADAIDNDIQTEKVVDYTEDANAEVVDFSTPETQPDPEPVETNQPDF